MEEYWEDPDTLNPSRFLPENEDKIVPGSYLPFNMGPRQCLGRMLAMNEMKIVLAMFFQRFKMLCDESHPIEEVLRITNQPKHGVKVFIHPRDNCIEYRL